VSILQRGIYFAAALTIMDKSIYCPFCDLQIKGEYEIMVGIPDELQFPC
jgi:hypothetical protein